MGAFKDLSIDLQEIQRMELQEKLLQNACVILEKEYRKESDNNIRKEILDDIRTVKGLIDENQKSIENIKRNWTEPEADFIGNHLAFVEG